MLDQQQKLCWPQIKHQWLPAPFLRSATRFFNSQHRDHFVNAPSQWEMMLHTQNDSCQQDVVRYVGTLSYVLISLKSLRAPALMMLYNMFVIIYVIREEIPIHHLLRKSLQLIRDEMLYWNLIFLYFKEILWCISESKVWGFESPSGQGTFSKSLTLSQERPFVSWKLLLLPMHS